jgi:hypothetical protein
MEGIRSTQKVWVENPKRKKSFGKGYLFSDIGIILKQFLRCRN